MVMPVSFSHQTTTRITVTDRKGSIAAARCFQADVRSMESKYGFKLLFAKCSPPS